MFTSNQSQTIPPIWISINEIKLTNWSRDSDRRVFSFRNPGKLNKNPKIRQLVSKNSIFQAKPNLSGQDSTGSFHPHVIGHQKRRFKNIPRVFKAPAFRLRVNRRNWKFSNTYPSKILWSRRSLLNTTSRILMIIQIKTCGKWQRLMGCKIHKNRDAIHFSNRAKLSFYNLKDCDQRLINRLGLFLWHGAR